MANKDLKGLRVQGLADTYLIPGAVVASGEGDESVITVAESAPNTAAGDGAFAAGMGNEASGDNAVALGYNNVASGDSSVAAGGKASGQRDNTASGAGAVALGTSNLASGNGAAAIGTKNTASGNASIAAGNTSEASAGSAVALGQGTKASAVGSVALGNQTEATGRASFVAGQFNEPDENPVDTSHGTGARKFLAIIGNGTSANDKSNAATLDWDGNMELAGKLTLGAAPSANMDAATKKYVDDAIPTVPSPSSTAPAMDGTAAAGSSAAYARADHVHPHDTAKLDVAQGVANAGKFLVVGSDGIVAPVTLAAWQGGSY